MSYLQKAISLLLAFKVHLLNTNLGLKKMRSIQSENIYKNYNIKYNINMSREIRREETPNGPMNPNGTSGYVEPLLGQIQHQLEGTLRDKGRVSTVEPQVAERYKKEYSNLIETCSYIEKNSEDPFIMPDLLKGEVEYLQSLPEIDLGRRKSELLQQYGLFVRTNGNIVTEIEPAINIINRLDRKAHAANPDATMYRDMLKKWGCDDDLSNLSDVKQQYESQYLSIEGDRDERASLEFWMRYQQCIDTIHMGPEYKAFGNIEFKLVNLWEEYWKLHPNAKMSFNDSISEEDVAVSKWWKDISIRMELLLQSCGLRIIKPERVGNCDPLATEFLNRPRTHPQQHDAVKVLRPGLIDANNFVRLPALVAY